MADGSGRMTVLLAAMLAVGGSAAQARATTGAAEAREQVAMGDLDLSSAAGRNAAQGRLSAAARAVCAEVGVDAVNQAALDGCEDEALRPARQQLARLAAAETRPGASPVAR